MDTDEAERFSIKRMKAIHPFVRFLHRNSKKLFSGIDRAVLSVERNHVPTPTIQLTHLTEEFITKNRRQPCAHVRSHPKRIPIGECANHRFLHEVSSHLTFLAEINGESRQVVVVLQ